jgi:hypothetical protein
MKEPTQIDDCLARIRQVKVSQVQFSLRMKDPKKNPFILMERLGITREEAVEDIIKTLTREECVSPYEENKSPGFIEHVWIFKRMHHFIENGRTKLICIYIKVSFPEGVPLMVISFHEDKKKGKS